QHVDITPTILDLVGATVPDQAQGHSIVPILRGDDDGSDRMAVTTVGDDSQTSIVMADGWKLILNRVDGTRELYYLPDDPDEVQNLAADQPGRVSAMGQSLDAWAAANRVTFAAGARSDTNGG
ncbi:MAG: hypothetical protein QOF51_378, partial [Chloroflexota bacterium]|nr:hypothetical protein [Chloroflexota bacterium]